MESRLLLNIITSISLLVPITLLIIKKWKNSKANISTKLPPGPKKLPIIGDLHRMTAIPFRCFRDLSQQYGPIMHLKLGEVSTIVVSSPEIAKEILKERDPNFADRPDSVGFKTMTYGYLDIAFSPYGDYWRQMRKICILELLSAKCVRAFATIRDDEISSLIKSVRLSSGKPINITEKIFSMTSSIICRAAFGKVCEESGVLVKLLREGIEMAGGFEIADLFPSWKMINALSWSKFRLARMQRKIDVILDDIIREHEEILGKMMRENGNLARSSGNGEFGDEDLVDVFLRIKESEELEFPIGYDNIKANLFEMFMGGTDTTASVIDWTMVELLRNPQVMAKAQAEVRQVFKGSKSIKENDDVHKLKYLKLLIMESLRLHPPGPLIPRASRDKCEINGYTIPAKVKVIVNNWAIQRDPNYWTNPESFEPERFENGSVNFVGGDFQLLPFGSGKRICPGLTFALATVELSLAQILYNFNWKLPDGINIDDLDMTEKFGSAVPRKAELFVVATPYG